MIISMIFKDLHYVKDVQQLAHVHLLPKNAGFLAILLASYILMFVSIPVISFFPISFELKRIHPDIVHKKKEY